MTIRHEYPEDGIPNAETLEAMAKVKEMIRTSSGQHFTGSAEDFFKMLMNSED